MAAMPSALIIVSVNTGAYMAEIIRGGIISVDKGQTEGALSIGMTHWQTMTEVVLPQAVRNIIPVSYTHLTLPTIAAECRSRWSPYH